MRFKYFPLFLHIIIAVLLIGIAKASAEKNINHFVLYPLDMFAFILGFTCFLRFLSYLTDDEF